MADRDRIYSFDGVGIQIVGPKPILSVIEGRLGQLPPLIDGANCSIRFTFEVTRTVAGHSVRRPHGNGRPCYQPLLGEVLYYPTDDVMYLSYGDHVKALCQPEAGTCCTSVLGIESEQLWFATHPFFTIPLVEMMKRRRKFSVHAAALGRGDRSAIFPGTTGAGKSTLAIGLLRAGLDFIADDMVFLDMDEGGITVFGLPEMLDVTEQTASMFPELRCLLSQSKRPGWPKYEIQATEIASYMPTLRSRPKALLFPKIGVSPHSEISNLTIDEAFMELVPNALLTERSSTKAHLDALSLLAKETPSYRLKTGTDFERLATTVREILV